MGDANSPPRCSLKEKRQAILDGLEVYAEVADLRRKLRETVTAWRAELSSAAWAQVRILIEERYSFNDPLSSTMAILVATGEQRPSLP